MKYMKFKALNNASDAPPNVGTSYKGSRIGASYFGVAHRIGVIFGVLCAFTIETGFAKENENGREQLSKELTNNLIEKKICSSPSECNQKTGRHIRHPEHGVYYRYYAPNKEALTQDIYYLLNNHEKYQKPIIIEVFQEPIDYYGNNLIRLIFDKKPIVTLEIK